MKFACAGCMYAYDESIWEPAVGIDAGTHFDDLWDEFYCPQCEGNKIHFSLLEQEINYPLDYEELTGLESEHFPIFIDKEEDWVKVQVGERIHESHEEHYVSSVTIYDEYEEMIEEKVLLSSEEAIVEFDVDHSEIYEIRVNCISHGLWARKIQHDT